MKLQDLREWIQSKANGEICFILPKRLEDNFTEVKYRFEAHLDSHLIDNHPVAVTSEFIISAPGSYLFKTKPEFRSRDYRLHPIYKPEFDRLIAYHEAFINHLTNDGWIQTGLKEPSWLPSQSCWDLDLLVRVGKSSWTSFSRPVTRVYKI